MIFERDLQSADHILPVEHPVVRLDVQQLNREKVCHTLQLAAGQHQRPGMAAAAPPLHDRSQPLEVLGLQMVQNAENVHIGMLRMKPPGDGRSIENHAFEIASRHLTQPHHQRFELPLDATG